MITFLLMILAAVAFIALVLLIGFTIMFEKELDSYDEEFREFIEEYTEHK